MGCSASTLDNEQTVTRCKDRKHYMKLAVRRRHAFAAAHMAYIQSLKNTGAALRQFAEGDSRDSQITTDRSPNPNPNSNSYKPPPLPVFMADPSPSPQLSRAVSMPHLRHSARNPNPNFSPIRKPPVLHEEREEEDNNDDGGEEEQDEEEEDDDDDGGDARRPPPSASPSTPASQRRHSSTWQEREAGESDMNGDAGELDAEVTPSPSPAKATTTGNSLSLSQVLARLDDKFLDAFESGKNVARLLEARKMHYHHNSAGYSESVEHSSRVLRVMSWGRNPDLQLPDMEHILGEREKETHASTLDKLLAWEKKLHDEVKTGEQVRIKLEKKAELLRVQRKRDVSKAVINETKALVKSLHTRYVVEIQAVDAAALEVDKLRDEHLHKQLVELVRRLSDMWKYMSDCHQEQQQAMANMGIVDRSMLPSTTDDNHYKNTEQLEKEINGWHNSLEQLLITQKEYMESIYNWLRLHIIQIESDGKEAPGSPQKMTTPAVYSLCREWRNKIDRLPGSPTLLALLAFSNLVEKVRASQDEELRQKKKLDNMRKEMEKKEQMLIKYREKWRSDGEEGTQEEGGVHSALKEKERMMKMLRDDLEVEKIRYEEMRSKSGSMALSSLEQGLPPVLRAMREFADSATRCYSELISVADRHGLSSSSSSVPQLTL